MSSENWTLEADTDVIHVLFPANDENENQVAAMMTSPSSGSSSLASASLLSSATPNSSGTSLAAAALAAGGHHEPPTAKQVGRPSISLTFLAKKKLASGQPFPR